MNPPKKLNDLLKGLTAATADRDIAAIATDSRALTPQTLWLAARGISHHALDFYNPELHPAAIAYEPPYENPPAGAIACEQLGAHLGEIAARFYDHPARALKLIGVTGTDGKSSLVHFLAQATGGAMLGTIGYGKLDALEPASHTTPDPLRVQQYLARFRDAGIETVAMEVSSHALAQGRVAAVEYHIGVFTNLSRDHLDYHRDMEDYFLAKASLFARPLPVAVINIDDAHGCRLLDENRVHPKTRVIAVSSQNHAHPRAALTLRARDIVLSPDGIAYTLETEAEQVAIQSGLLARFNVDNLLNTAACLLALGTPLAAIPAKLAALHGVPGRAERIGLGNGAAAIIDYAHTPAALANILQGVRAHVPGKLWCIYGCGGDRDRGKRPLMAQAAEQYADAVVITDDNPRTENPADIIADSLRGMGHREKAWIKRPREEAIRFVLPQLEAGDAVVIAGKGHEDYQILGTTKHHYSDQETVRTWLQNR
ncbi:UDP-N-acetylmuramoylalanyl-D-glutamate--2,6-diaminopimelate ligase [Cardiobacterium hominis]|uniref:UDP-N-acetylmuramoyl-L-alanyl-D-glutamate--2,6-diaminopimelate ligase n=1 Tax=Cardiobacterium hominis TaxID=2718 RepID=A0A1C3H4S3_9GAMM|nr:UDP-N-acetylmuramoyl-L-alanyl-D-glutamate--2,6-diaminopimelate ligase [Cardiobacterium hominis]SAM65806.1 UDP-N-acetylmuramoylalanyl-D-glutamate--2,6-diaminopimelate ligase [Cardiobacterium hominis]